MAIFDKQLNKASLTGRVALGISLIVIPLVIVLIVVLVKISTVNIYAEKLTEEYIDIMQTADQMVIDVNAANKGIQKYAADHQADGRLLAQQNIKLASDKMTLLTSYIGAQIEPEIRQQYETCNNAFVKFKATVESCVASDGSGDLTVGAVDGQSAGKSGGGVRGPLRREGRAAGPLRGQGPGDPGGVRPQGQRACRLR